MSHEAAASLPVCHAPTCRFDGMCDVKRYGCFDDFEQDYRNITDFKLNFHIMPIFYLHHHVDCTYYDYHT